MLAKSSFIAFLSLAGIATADSSIKCFDADNTIHAYFTYDSTHPMAESHEIITLTYGTCTEADLGDKITVARTTNSVTGRDTDFDITIKVTECGMGTILSSNYVHEGSFIIGHDVLIYRTLALYARCWEELNISFSYQNIESDTTGADSFSFTGSGGTIVLDFAVKPFTDGTFDNEITDMSRVPQYGGQTIYLGLLLTNAALFDYAARKFAPTDCTVVSVSDPSLKYELFNYATTTTACHDSAINFNLDYDVSEHVWRMDHILFLLGSYDSSEFELHCGIRLCDNRDTSACDAVANACLSGQAQTDFLQQVTQG